MYNIYIIYNYIIHMYNIYIENTPNNIGAPRAVGPKYRFIYIIYIYYIYNIIYMYNIYRIYIYIERERETYLHIFKHIWLIFKFFEYLNIIDTYLNIFD